MKQKINLLLSTLVEIAQDIAKESYIVEEQSKNRDCRNRCDGFCDVCPCYDNCFGFVEQNPKRFENVMPRQTREPDGVDIHVDRPRRENYWSHHKWAVDMSNYRMLIDQAKKCDWPCKEPMKGVPNYAVTRDWYDENPHLW